MSGFRYVEELNRPMVHAGFDPKLCTFFVGGGIYTKDN